MTIEAIKAAISELSDEDCRSLAAWLTKKGYDEWDREMVADFSSGGRGTKFFDEIEREVAEGKAASLADGLAERRLRRT